MAENYYWGNNNYVQDTNKAIKLYVQAAELGCSGAFLYIGIFYKDHKNYEKALEYFEEGIRRGMNAVGLK